MAERPGMPEEESWSVRSADAVVTEHERLDAEVYARVCRALDVADAQVIASADCAADGVDGTRWLRFPTHLSGTFRDHGMTKALALADVARRTPQMARALSPEGIDLLEIAMIDWANHLGPALRAEWVLDRLRATPAITRVAWIARPGRYGVFFAQDCARRLRRAGRQVVVFDPAGWPVGRSFAGWKLGAAGWWSVWTRCRTIRESRDLNVTPSPEVARVVCVEAYGKNARMVAPVLGRLEATGAAEAIMVAVRDDAATAARAAGVRDVRTLDQCLPRGAMIRSLRWQFVVSAALARWHGGGVAHWQSAEVRAITGSAWREAAHQAALWRSIWRVLTPDAVVSTSQANGFGRAAAAAAHQRGTPSVFVQHGLLGHDQFERQVLARHQLLWGAWDVRRRCATGFPASTLSVVGPLGLDGLPATTPPRTSGRRRVVYLPPMTGGQWTSTDNARQIWARVLDATADDPHLELVVKLHPGDRSSLYDGVPRVLRLQQEPAVEVMRTADVVLVTTSTAGLEACALGRPVIVLRHPAVRVFPQYLEFEAFLHAHNTEDLRRLLSDLAADEDVQRRLREARATLVDDLFGGLRPGAADRAAAVILDLARTRRVAS